MRLIDIDKVVSDYKAKNKSLQNVTWFELTDYEVKAIPIDWIEKHIEQYYDDGYNSYGKALNIMLADWREENETNRQR